MNQLIPNRLLMMNPSGIFRALRKVLRTATIGFCKYLITNDMRSVGISPIFELMMPLMLNSNYKLMICTTRPSEIFNLAPRWNLSVMRVNTCLRVVFVGSLFGLH